MAPPDAHLRRASERRIERAIPDFATGAFLHAQARTELMRRLQPVQMSVQSILDLGGGPGLGARALVRQFPKAAVTLVDRSPSMLRAAARARGWWRKFECLEADATALPIADGSVDLVVASMLMPGLPHPEILLTEVRRVLKPRGYFVFTTLGASSLRELSTAFASADAEVPHLNDLIDFHDLGDALTRAGFVAPVLDTDRLTVTYRTLNDACRDLRAGAAPLPTTVRRSLTGRARWRAAEEAFSQGRGSDGRIPVTCELVYGQAWAPDVQDVRRPGPTREVVVPLTTLRRRS